MAFRTRGKNILQNKDKTEKERLTVQLKELKKNILQNNRGRTASRTRTKISLYYVKRIFIYEGKYRKKERMLCSGEYPDL